MPAKILVVDDSKSDRLIIEKMLSDYNVLVACDGLEAMRKIDEHKDIDLLLLDLNMPNIDGFELLKVLKCDDEHKNMRIVILTNHDEPENEIKGLELGAIDYIRKPIHVCSLRAKIDIHIELLRIQQILEHKLHEIDLTFDTIFQQAPIGIAILHYVESSNTNKSIITNINPKFEQITGRTKEELIKIGWEKITHPDDLEEDMNFFEKLIAGKIKDYSMEERYIKPDGSIVWVHMVVAPLVFADGTKRSQICLVQDITKRKEIEAELLESERSKSVLLSHLPGLAYRCNYDRDWTMQYVSKGCFDLTGYPAESLLHNNKISFNELILPKYREPIWEEWKNILEKKAPFNYEYQIMTASGETKWVMEMGQGIYNERGEVEALEGIILDISERKEIENNLRYISEHDSLTGLHNRVYLEKTMKSDTMKKNDRKKAVVGINLSPVQSLTVTYGFHYTQDLIKKIADTLKRYSTDKYLLFNTYENRFVFYIKDYKDKDELLMLCKSIIIPLEALLSVERVSYGIGVVEIEPNNEMDVDQILKKLLITSEKAIDIYDYDFPVCFHDADMEAQIIRKENIKQELAKVVSDENNGGLFLQYQPILDLRTNRISEFEVLARIKSDTLGLVSPREFIPIAEETKLIIPIGKKIFIQALRFLKELEGYGYNEINISINISVIQLLKKDFCKNVIEMIKNERVCPENVVIEITESVFSSDFQEINNVIGKLRKHGIHISIDDFGTGYSSLSRERDLNVNFIKIDKSFIDKLLLIDLDKAITGDIIAMAHKMGHCVIAEGVEEEKQKQSLCNWGCDKIQGYLISKPLDEEAAINFLKSRS